MEDEPEPRRASMDLDRGKLETNVMRSASSRDGLRGRFAPGSPGVAAASAFTSANAATLRAEVSAHRLNHQAMREVLREVSSLPPESSADADAEARRILRDAVALMTVGEKMVIDAARRGQKLGWFDAVAAGLGASLPHARLRAERGRAGLLRQYDPSGSGDPESFRDKPGSPAAACGAMVVRRAADKSRARAVPARRRGRRSGRRRAAKPPVAALLVTKTKTTRKPRRS